MNSSKLKVWWYMPKGNSIQLRYLEVLKKFSEARNNG